MLNNGLNCFNERQYLSSSSSKRNLNINKIKCTNGFKIDLLLKFLFIENSVNNGLVNEFLLRVYIDFNLIDSLSNNNEENSKTTQSSSTIPWFQPLSWLTATTSSAYATLTNSSFDDNFVQQQFSYDKRIYKEFSFIGFYLSICEEHVENEIELWKQLKQYLYQNSIELIQRNVELYGVKLIQQTNKIKNLNISQNLNIKHLMIYKWCERAWCEPLLVLYWQAFFNIIQISD